MTKNNYFRISQVFALLAVISAISFHGVYTFYLQTPVLSFDSFFEVTIFCLALLFILLPTLALASLLLKKPWGILPLIVFPIVATVFSIAAIPFLLQLFPVGAIRGIFVIVINSMFFGATIYIGLKLNKQQND